MYIDGKIWIAKGDEPVYLLPKMANRHGLIAGATGTGKTTTLKVLAESFSDMGVPVFLADIKGDLAGLALTGEENQRVRERLETLGINGFTFDSYPVRFFDVFGEKGHPVRASVSEMGALLLSRLLGLNEIQSGILNIIFRIADERGLLLINLADLRAMIRYVGDNAKEFTLTYGNISSQSIGAILRNLMVLEDQGAEHFFGEPELDINDWIQRDQNGKGYINILDSTRLFHSPALYSTFLLFMLSELFETLPESGDTEAPKIVFFFDEAHILFDDAPKALKQKIEQVVRLIRSKGVGVYFITQSPSDLPQEVLGQLGNRVQHALRAFTSAEQKLIRAAAETFRENPDFDTERVLTELGTGEALVSCLEEDGKPGMVRRAFILPPRSRFGIIDDELRKQIIAASPLNGKYNASIDRESAFEILEEEEKRDENDRQQEAARKERQQQWDLEKKQWEQEQKSRRRNQSGSGSGYKRQTPLEKATNAAVSTIGRELGRVLIRGILGSLKK